MTSDLDGAGKVKELPLLWVLNQSDGMNSLLDIADRSGLAFDEVKQAADSLVACGLLKELEPISKLLTA
jgi:aminopeptidase-like protein